MPVKQQAYFRYTRLEFNDSIRLLKIRQGKSGDPIDTSLSHETLDTIGNCYYALSYTWGTDSTARFILVNGFPFCVQPNLRDALEAIRRPDQDLLLWVDAICLNQEDTQEKNHQVGQMGKIYEAAQSTYLWLGQSADGSESCFDYMNQDRKPPSQWTPIDPLRTAINALMSRPYWERAWIRQELLLAQNITIYCGDRITSWERFSAVIMCEDLMPTWSRGHELACDRQQRALHESRPQKPLMTQLMWYSPAKCKDIRDRIFALLPLASNRDRFGRDFVDYTLDSYTIFLGMLHLHARPSFLTTVINLQRHLEINFHKYMQLDNKLRISSSPMDGSSRIASSHRSKSSDETSSVLTFATSEKCTEGSTNSILSRSASGLRNYIAEVYDEMEKRSLLTRSQTSGLQSAICCLRSMNDCTYPSGGRGDHQQWVYLVPGTDIALQFHHPGPFFVLRRVLRAPWVTKLHQIPLQDTDYLPSDENFQALCDLTWFPDFLESVLSEHDTTTDPDPYPQDEMTGENPSEADFIEVAMMILSCESERSMSACLEPRYGDSAESLVKPGSDMLRKIFTQIHQRHKSTTKYIESTIDEPRFNQNGTLLVLGFGRKAKKQPLSQIDGRTSSENGTSMVSAANFAVISINNVACKPKSLSFEEAASIPLAYMTAASAIHWALGVPLRFLKDGQNTGFEPKSVMVLGGNSSVGSATVQLLRITLPDASLISTSSPKHHAHIKSLGANTVLDYTAADVVQEIYIASPGGSGVEAIVDTVNGVVTNPELLQTLTGPKQFAEVVTGQMATDIPAEITHTLVFGRKVMTPSGGPNLFSALGVLLASGEYKPPLPITVVGEGLESIGEGLEKLKAGVSGTKLVIKL